MKFVFGPVPENSAFHPEEEGWRQLKEPSPGIAQFLAVPIGIAVLILIIAAWRVLTPARFSSAEPIFFVLYSLLTLIIIVPIHEYIHALCHPFGGRSTETVFGFWPAKFVFYAHYDAEMSRNRFLLVLAAPFLLLSVLPVFVCAVLSLAPPPVLWISTMNTLVASLDLFGILLISLQTPAASVLQNKGYRTWWRLA